MADFRQEVWKAYVDARFDLYKALLDQYQAAEARRKEIEEQAKTLSSQAQQATATARRLREQIDLSRLLTGLDVKICPNCARGIEAAAVEREKDSHQCRLCVRPVPAADEDEEAVLQAAAKDYDQQAAQLKARAAEVNRDLAAARKRAENAQSLTETLQKTINEGVTKGLPTPEENDKRGKLHEEIGGINQEIAGIERALSGGSAENHERKGKIIEKVLMEEGRPPESIFDFVQGITRLARDKTQQDARLDMEGRAKKLLDRVG